jgi:hypothetical protein
VTDLSGIGSGLRFNNSQYREDFLCVSGRKG